MSEATTVIVSLLFVTCVSVLSHWISAQLPAIGTVSALFIALIRTIAGMGLQRGRRWSGEARRCFLRNAAPGLVLLGAAPLWAISGASFQGVTTVFPTGTVALNFPQGMAVDSQGNVYITDINRVVVVTADGVSSVLTSFPGLTPPTLHAPEAVVVDGSGNLYIADTNNARVIELAAGVASVVNTGALLVSPDGLALDAAGDLYIADATKNYIVKVPAGGTAAVFAISGPGAGLSGPQGLAVDASGNLYIADSGNSQVVEATPDGVGSVFNLDGYTLSNDVGVAVDGTGNVYVADLFGQRIVTVTPAGVGRALNLGTAALNQPKGLAVDVFGTLYITDFNNSRIVETQPTTVNFGHLTGASTQTSLTFPFTLGSSVTLGSVQAFGLGVANSDFSVASSPNTCSPGITNQPCTVTINFSPQYAGLRRGAVALFGSTGVPILTVPVYGTFDSPLAALSPGAAAVVNTGSVSISSPLQIALDNSGDAYVANVGGNNVVKIAGGGGGASVVSTGSVTVGSVGGVALDGAGNLYIADQSNNDIVQVTPAGVGSVLTISGPVSALSAPLSPVLDAAGNLYIVDSNHSRIVKVTPAGVGSVVATGSITLGGAGGASSVAVDAAGTVYIADPANNEVVKVTANGAATLVVPAGITLVLNGPQGVSVDGMGNVYIADTLNSRIVEVTTAGVASVLQTPGLTNPATLHNPVAVTADNFGNIIIADSANNRLVLVNVAGASLAFPNTTVGSTSPPQTATVTNIGDLPLVFSVNPTYTATFSEDAGDTNLCATSAPLAAGMACDVSVEFTPQSAQALSAGILVTDNTFNSIVAPTQTVAVSGNGVTPGDTTAVIVSTNPASANLGQPLSVTAVVSDTAAGHTATVPTGGVMFMDTVGATSISLNGGIAVTLNGTGQAILTGVTLSGAGLHTITASYAGVSGTFSASSSTTTLTVSQDTATITGSAAQPVQVVNGLGGSVPVTATGPYSVSVVAAPTGSLSYNVLNSSNASVASGTATLTPGSTNSSATVPLASSLASGSYTVSVTYGGDGNYAASPSAIVISVVVGPAPPTINWTAPAGGITYGATLSGILNASAVSGSTPVAGTFAYTATLAGGSPVAVIGATVLSAGSYTLTAAFTPTATSTYGSTSASVSLPVAQATPAVALISSAAAVTVESAVTFTATVSSGAGTPSGSVSFYAGTTLLGSGTLSLGMAIYTTTNLPAGALSITAMYGGDGNFLTLTSSALTETVMTAFAVTAPTTSVTVAPGGTVTVGITVPPLGGAFNGVVTLSAFGVPPGASATFNPPTVTPGSAGVPTVMTIQMAATTASVPASRGPGHHGGFPLVPFSLGFVAFGAVLGRKRIPRRLALVLALAAAGVATSQLTGCGGGGASTGASANTPPTQAGNYSITVTGTSGAFQASTTITLAVE